MSKRQQTALVPYVFDNRPPIKRGKRITKKPVFAVGQRLALGRTSHGGGGPENRGSMNVIQAGNKMNQSQPSWRWAFDDDFVGPAAPSTKPVVVASHAQPANSFRKLGDLYGGRQ